MKTVQMGPKSTFTQRATRFGRGVGLAALLAMSVVGTALADNPGLTITGSPVAAAAGTVTYSINNADYGSTNSIALNGTAHTIEIKVPVAASDYSGADAGWHTDFSLSQFKTAGDVLLGETALDVVKAGSAACDTTGSKVCSNSNAAVINYATATTYTTGAAAIKIFKSDDTTHVAGIGMGQYTYDTEVGFTLPATAKAGAYSSPLTVTAVAAP